MKITETDLLNLLDELLALPAETEWVEFKEAKRSYDFNGVYGFESPSIGSMK